MVSWVCVSAGVISSERSTPVVTRKKTGKKEKQQIYIKTEGKKEAGEREKGGESIISFQSRR